MNKKKIISFIPVLLIMIAIFIFSSHNGNESSEISSTLSLKLQEILDFLREYQIFENLEHILRKSAHFIIYTALGFFMFLHMKSYNISQKIRFIISLVFCFCYAVSDEIHQLFVEGRSGQFSDVLLDTSGSLTGIIIIFLILRISDKKTGEN